MIINCSRCGREISAMEVHVKLCTKCMLDVLKSEEAVGKAFRAGNYVPRRVGIAQKGDLVILEMLKQQMPEDRCRIANELVKIREETGIRFLILDSEQIRLARIDDGDGGETACEVNRNEP